MNINPLLHNIWGSAKRIIIAIIHNIKFQKKPNLLTYAEKLIAADMEPQLAKIYEDIMSKLFAFKRDIHNHYINPTIRTKEILDDIAIFCRDLLDAGEKKEVVNIHNEAYRDLILFLLIDRFGFYPFKSQLVNLPSNKSKNCTVSV